MLKIGKNPVIHKAGFLSTFSVFWQNLANFQKAVFWPFFHTLVFYNTNHVRPFVTYYKR